jgi:GTP-binding protein YchF
LPNVGKSTLFNALTATAAAAAENFPFCTIEPNVGRVPVPDSRLAKLGSLSKSAKVVPTQLEFVDIAGLVAGASKGEGLGNQFLGHIREVDAIVQVLRCFEDPDITHVSGSVDPIRDIEIIETELMLADLESLEKRIPALVKKVRGNDAEAKTTLSLCERAFAVIQDGKLASATEIADEESKSFRALGLITAKPVLYASNIDEDHAAEGNTFTEAVAERARANGTQSILVSARVEAEAAELSDADRLEFLASLGLIETGLDRIIRAGHSLLQLITFFTTGPKESRAWTIKAGSKAPAAAGVIHSDFERGFIRAETIAFEDFITLGGEAAARDAGKMRAEGRDYIVRDGDVMLFRFNV